MVPEDSTLTWGDLHDCFNLRCTTNRAVRLRKGLTFCAVLGLARPLVVCAGQLPALPRRLAGERGRVAQSVDEHVGRGGDGGAPGHCQNRGPH